MRRAIVPLFIVVFLAGVSLASAGEDAPAQTPTVAEFTARLGSPVLPDSLEGVLAELDLTRVDVASNLARALGRAGGAAAAKELTALAGHPDEGVRIVAWQAAALVGLRSEPLARAARGALTSSRGAERVAATSLLGRIGDGRDVPVLLALLEALTATPEERSAICRALSRLGGVALHENPHRWRVWWQAVATRDYPQVAVGLAALTDPSCLHHDLHRAVVHRIGWLDVPAVRVAATSWLAQPDSTLRAEACRLVAVFGLANLGPAVYSARCFDLRSAYSADADAALRRLGLLPEPCEAPAEDEARLSLTQR